MATPPKPSELIEEAAAWLAALDAGSATREDFEAWRAADSRRAVAFAQVVDAFEQIEPLRVVHEPLPKPSRLNRRNLLRGGVLAGGIAIVGGTVAMQAAAREHAETGVGERRSIVLEDGTRLLLNTDTRLSWRIKGTTRSLWLERGEIGLDVRTAAGPALRLFANGMHFDLRSGSFNARREPETVALLVLQGTASSDGRQVAAGALAQVIGRDLAVRPAEAVAIDRARSWKDGQLVFEGESLDFVAAEFNRYLENKLVVADPSLSRIRLGGRFTNTDPVELLKALEASFGIHAHRSESGAIMLTAS
ncbi:FecR family protein [Novosphingobium resinovorum]|uniref:FecR family protein n=1 Tax=Novosphingobium resinovorum TaxID=158500 RepID=UPI002ED42618|nr:FecR domain-containing protein [Novosphingobium resinovorum]